MPVHVCREVVLVYMCHIDLPNGNIMIVCSCYGRRVSVFSDHNNDVMRRDR